MKLSTKEIDIVKNFFADKPVLRAYVFGSFARDEANNNSDLDILVELDYSQRIGLGFIKMKFELEKLLKKNIDLVSNKAVSKYILPYINQDKQLIYEK